MNPYLRPKLVKNRKIDWALEWGSGEEVGIKEALILKERLDDFIEHWVRRHVENDD